MLTARLLGAQHRSVLVSRSGQGAEGWHQGGAGRVAHVPVQPARHFLCCYSCALFTGSSVREFVANTLAMLGTAAGGHQPSPSGIGAAKLFTAAHREGGGLRAVGVGRLCQVSAGRVAVVPLHRFLVTLQQRRALRPAVSVAQVVHRQSGTPQAPSARCVRRGKCGSREM